jgi:hypothetical protein
MKKIILFLFIWLTFFLPIETSISQTPTKNEGFWIEVHNHNSAIPISKNFISIETIKIQPADSVLTNLKNRQTIRAWYGANLCQLFKSALNISCDRIQKLSISAADGYTSVLSGELLTSLPTAICAYLTKNQKDWSENYGYMRLIFPALRNMYWVNSPKKMIITIGEDQNPVHQYQFYFLDSERLNNLIKQGLKGNPYFVIDDLLVELNLVRQNFHVLTTDGLYREYPPNEISRYLLFQKQQTGYWQINGVNVPDGLKTKNVFFLSSGNAGIFLKNLNNEEQQLWERLFWQPLQRETFLVNDLKVELILNDGRNISLKLTSQLSNDKLSFCNLLEKEWNEHRDIDNVIVSW